MATIVIKNSSVAAKVPLPGDLVAGELALNTTDGSLYCKDNGGSVIKIGQNYANFNTSIIPSADITYDLGSPTKQWRDIYVGPGSFYVNGQKVLEDVSGTITLSADLDQNVQIKATGTGDVELLPAGTGIVQVKGTISVLAGKNIISSDGGNISFTDGINMNSNKITGIGTPTVSTDAANKNYVDTYTGFLRSDTSDTYAGGTLTIDNAAQIVWGTTPTSASHLANKQYVDNLFATGATWRNPVVDSDLVDVVGSNPATPEATYGVSTGADIAFIATAAFTFSYGTGSTVVATSGSIVNLRITSSGNGDYTLIEHPLEAGDRFIIGAEHGTIGTGLSSLVVGGFALANHDLIEFTGTGNGSSAASWSTPEGRSGLAGGGTEFTQGITVLVSDPDSLHHGHSYTYNAEDNAWVEISGPGSVGAGNHLSYSGDTLNVDDDFLLNTGDSLAGNLTPDANNTRNLGSGALKWANVYATTFQGEATSAQYADLAEIYEADDNIAPGTVVCFGGEKEVTTCTHDHDQRVAGVVSTNPAYLMNSSADGVAVALMGRVPCKVSGSIKKGDMLVSDGKGGARAEMNPKMGAVIGKALEDSEGDAVIEVVVGRM